MPFFLQTGKRLHRRSSEIAIYFKRPPYLPFKRSAVPDLRPKCLVLHIQPEQGVTLSIGAKVPGPNIRIRNVDMEFMYERNFKERSPEAYEHLLLESIVGDTTMFTRGDEVEAAWRLVTSVHRAGRRRTRRCTPTAPVRRAPKPGGTCWAASPVPGGATSSPLNRGSAT